MIVVLFFCYIFYCRCLYRISALQSLGVLRITLYVMPYYFFGPLLSSEYLLWNVDYSTFAICLLIGYVLGIVKNLDNVKSYFNVEIVQAMLSEVSNKRNFELIYSAIVFAIGEELFFRVGFSSIEFPLFFQLLASSAFFVLGHILMPWSSQRLLSWESAYQVAFSFAAFGLIFLTEDWTSAVAFHLGHNLFSVTPRFIVLINRIRNVC